jgi:hypothetical protein
VAVAFEVQRSAEEQREAAWGGLEAEAGELPVWGGDSDCLTEGGIVGGGGAKGELEVEVDEWREKEGECQRFGGRAAG